MHDLPPFAPYLQHDFPDIQKITRLLDIGTTPIRCGEKIFNESGVFYADEHLFDVFSIKILEGNPKDALKNPFSVMLTQEMATKYFGSEDPMNKTIRFRNKYDFKVTGIYQAYPPTAHMHPSMLLSFNTLNDTAIYGAENLRTDWGNNSFYTYLLLPAHYNVQSMVARFPALVSKYMNRQDFNGMDPSKFTSLGLQKLTDIHLRSHTDDEAEENGDASRVYIFSAIALFILLIACINYMNLSTARSTLRAREIGIRKVIGADRKEIILQFLTESVLLTCLATLVALGLLHLVLPLIKDLSGLPLRAEMLASWPTMLAILLTPLALGVLAGSYPALFMSRFQPIRTLKGLLKPAKGSNISFRKALVVTQFAISIILIISSVVVFQQLRYMQQSALGFDKDHLIVTPYDNALADRYESFRSELLQHPGITAITRSSRIPSGRLLDDENAYTLSGDSMRPLTTDIKYIAIDEDFVDAFGIHLAAGRNFSRLLKTDTANFLLNEAAARVIGWAVPRQAIGQVFQYGTTKGHVIGVVKDFHFESLAQPIVPMVFVLPPPAQYGFFSRMSIKIAGSHTTQALALVEQTWKRFLPETPFEYSFLDERLGKLYSSEQRQGTIFMVFGCVAIFIASLGLFGLSAFTITQRIKEIGIRKVLGASVAQLVRMLARDFLRLVLIASVIAFPIAWMAMNRWLNDFAFRIQIAWWVFGAAGLAAASIALATISVQTIKASLANPARSLRTE